MLDKPSSQVLVENNVHLFCNNGFILYGLERTGGVSGGMDILKGSGQEPRSVGDVENKSW